jgi:hypothetical protein
MGGLSLLSGSSLGLDHRQSLYGHGVGNISALITARTGREQMGPKRGPKFLGVSGIEN